MIMMTSFNSLRKKLIKVLRDWPDGRQDEQAPGMGMTWKNLAFCAVHSGKSRSRVDRVLRRPGGRARLQKILKRAVDVGLIK